uniref:Uncharacterized protein n=1 Tax=Aegilops tauschii subsp. strangulata TaxID=200361 RepID=A0A453CL10_AEGTS
HKIHHMDKFEGVPYGLFLGPKGAGGRWWPRRTGAGARQDQPDSEHLKDSGHGGIRS